MAAERPHDPYPLMNLEYAVNALKVRFGADNVIVEKSQIRVRVQYPGDRKRVGVPLTGEQAKFLVAHPISTKDLIEENYPADWPGSARRRSTIPGPSHRGVEPVRFKRKKS